MPFALLASHLHLHLSPGAVVLAVLGLAVAYVLLVLASPTRRCPRCKGERVALRWLSRRFRPCRRCSGTGRAPRRGAVALHRVVWAIRTERNKP